MLKCCSCCVSQPVLILWQYLFTNPPFKVVLTLMDDASPDHWVSSVTYCQHVRGFLKALLASFPPLLCHGLSSLIQRNKFPLLSYCSSLVANSMKPHICRCCYKWLLFLHPFFLWAASWIIRKAQKLLALLGFSCSPSCYCLQSNTSVLVELQGSCVSLSAMPNKLWGTLGCLAVHICKLPPPLRLTFVIELRIFTFFYISSAS